MMARFKLLGGQNASSTNSLDFLLGLAGEETSLHDDGLLGEGVPYQEPGSTRMKQCLKMKIGND